MLTVKKIFFFLIVAKKFFWKLTKKFDTKKKANYGNIIIHYYYYYFNTADGTNLHKISFQQSSAQAICMQQMWPNYLSESQMILETNCVKPRQDKSYTHHTQKVQFPPLLNFIYSRSDFPAVPLTFWHTWIVFCNHHHRHTIQFPQWY